MCISYVKNFTAIFLSFIGQTYTNSNFQQPINIDAFTRPFV